MPNEILDPDYLAFETAQKEGKFAELEPGTYVAFYNGIWIATAESFERITAVEAMQGLVGDAYIDQVDRITPKRSINRGPRRPRQT